jgi:hypothetical protein
MGTLATELASFAGESGEPRVYVDANMPNGVVAYMRHTLGWDVFFVMEHEDLRRARDVEHYRMARQLGRTLVTLDRDYENDRLFPPDQSGGVIVFWAPDERRLCELLDRVDREIFRAEGADRLPLAGRKVRWSPGV